MNTEIGERIAAARQATGLNIKNAAGVTDIKSYPLKEYELGTEKPTLEDLVKMARAYHVSTDFLLGVGRNETIDITGLTSREVTLVRAIVKDMAEKNRKL